VRFEAVTAVNISALFSAVTRHVARGWRQYVSPKLMYLPTSPHDLKLFIQTRYLCINNCSEVLSFGISANKVTSE
jgi:hypothetical protein